MYEIDTYLQFPTSDLVKNQTAVKNAAREKMVLITEHGTPTFVFASNEVFQNEVDAAVAEALEAIEMRQILLRGRANREQGNYITGIDAARKEAKKRRK
ncbi:MAG: hypothetical protein IJ113_02930 [Eggerthellaceae bacterium]|nr:hypothetical protein [Eggerthellaceae bacterium]